MAAISGSFRESQIVDLAAAEVAINAFFTSQNARMIVLGGAATLITGSMTISMLCDNGAGATYSHRTTQTINCPLVADTVTLVAALEIFLTAVEAESAYTNIQEIDINMSIRMSN